MRICDMPEFRDKTNVLSFEPENTIAEAIDAMHEKNYGAIIITKNEKLVGIFTERDLLRRVAAKRLDIETTQLKEVMTTNISTANIDDRISESLRRMSQGRFRHMPVIDDQGKLKGLLSQGDFVAYTLSDAIYRVGISATANIFDRKTPLLKIIVTVAAYGLALIYLISLLTDWA